MRPVVPLRTAAEFAALATPQAVSVRGSRMRLVWLRNGRPGNRWGIRVSSKPPPRVNAVRRNRLRRQVRALICQAQQAHPVGYDLLVIVTCTSPPTTFQQLQSEWQRLLAEWRTRAAPIS